MISLTIVKIEYGWADIDFLIGSQSLTIVFEYTPHDALTDLIQSAIRIFYGNNSKVVFPYWPETEILTVERIDDYICRIAVSEYSKRTDCQAIYSSCT